ncbi:MAG: hypothetical protein AB7G11_02675 [Phycisphaerales bacterium]
MGSGRNLCDEIQVVHGLGPVAPSTSVPDYISLKDVAYCEAVIIGLNGSTVTGSAITLKQAQAVANTGEKALAFTTYYACADTAATTLLVKTTASSNTFTTTNTNSKTFLYRIPIDPATLDINNGFDCVRVGTGDAVNSTIAVFFNIVPKYGGNAVLFPNPIVD